MDEYCPLCRKMGNYKKIRAVQVNYDEAVWLCEEEQCPWPFGYEEFKFMPRRFEELSKKPTNSQKKKESTAISTELGIYTPPVTPSNEASSKEAGKIDNSFVTSTTLSSNHNDKISTSSTVVSIHPQKNENCQVSNDNVNSEKLAKPVSSIFDIDSSISVAKIGQKRGVKFGVKSTTKKVCRNSPQIRSIETFSNSLIKIELKEEQSSCGTAVDSFKDKNVASVAPTSQVVKTVAHPVKIEVQSCDQLDEPPKKIFKIPSLEFNEKNCNQLLTSSDTVNSQNSQMVENGTEAIDYSGVAGFETEGHLIDDAGQGLELLEEMLLGECENPSQEIDDDWLNSMLI